MTLPNNNQKLDKNEVESIKNAVEDSGIRAVHPDKMEAMLSIL